MTATDNRRETGPRGPRRDATLATQTVRALADYSRCPRTPPPGTAAATATPGVPTSSGTDSSLVVSITVDADRTCRAINHTYRLDTPEARAFLGQFVVLP